MRKCVIMINIKENELKEDCLGLQIEKTLTVMLMGL